VSKAYRNVVKLNGLAVNVKEYGATGDGVTDDRPAVTAALATLTAGGTLYFPPGNYNMKSPQITDAAIVLPVGVNLAMAGNAWLISTQGIFDATNGGSFIAPLGNNIIQCNIDGGAYPATGGVKGTWATWVNVGIRCYSSTAIGLGAESVVVTNSEIKNLSYPVQIYGAKNWRIHNNRFHRYRQSGVLAGFFAGYDCLRNVISNNVFEDAGDYAVAFFQVGGEAAGTGAYNSVIGNTAKNMQQRTNGYAYGVEQGDPAYQHHFLFANNVYECTSDGTAGGNGGITVATCADTLVTGNVLRGLETGTGQNTGINSVGAGTPHKFAERITIAHNLIENFRLYGISATGGKDIKIIGNNIKNCGGSVAAHPPIYAGSGGIGGSAALPWDTVIVENNTIETTSDYTNFGSGTATILVNRLSGVAGKNAIIKGNTLINPSDFGISVTGVSGALLQNVNVSNNHIIGTQDATFFQRQALQLDYVDDFSVCGNTIFDARVGISLTNSTNGTASENEVKGSLTLTYLLNIGTATTGLLWRNNECTAALTNVFAAASGSDTQFTTPANNNRAVGGSGLVSGAKGKTAAIASGATVTHGLSLTPTVVTVTAATSGASDVHVSAISSTTFTVTFSGGGSEEFYWRADF
jgi:parallel beta-helix repeat protein